MLLLLSFGVKLTTATFFCKFLLGNFLAVSLSRKKVLTEFFFEWARFCSFVNEFQIILLIIIITFL